MHGIEDLNTRAYGEKPYYNMTLEMHTTLVKHGFLYYTLRALEALHPTGKLLTKEEEHLISIVNTFIIDAEKARELRHQTRNYPHLITLESLSAFAKIVIQGKLLQKVQGILRSKYIPKSRSHCNWELLNFALKPRNWLGIKWKGSLKLRVFYF